MDISRTQRGIIVRFSRAEVETLRFEGSLHRAGPRGSGVEVVYDESASLAVSAEGDMARITTNSLVLPVTIDPVNVESTRGAFIGNNESVTLAS